METKHDAKITAAEISQLWTQFQNDSMSLCMLEYFLGTVENQEIATLIKKGLEWSRSHIEKLKLFFNEENWPIPQGYTEEDVDLSAPRLFSDTFMLFFIQQSSILGMGAYSLAVTLSARKDLHAYFSKCLSETMQLHEEANEILLKKGIYVRSPFLSAPDKFKFVKDEDFLGGWFGENRSLLSTEIAALFSNIQRNSLTQTLLTGFAQTASSQNIRNNMIGGKNLVVNHIEVFSTLLKESDLPASVTWDNQVTAATTAPFSDKLMMAQSNLFLSANIGLYGTSISSSLRKDLISEYTRLTAEIVNYLHKGTQIMIKNEWLEEPPQAVNHVQLSKTRL